MKLPSLTPLLWGVTGFACGVLTTWFMLYLPSQRLVRERENALIEMAKFNREEQERISQMREISTSAMQRWVALSDKTNTDYLKLQQTLQKQESLLADPGWFLLPMVMILVGFVAGLYIWSNREENLRDSATFDNFESFLTARLNAIAKTQNELDSIEQKADSTNNRLEDGRNDS